MNTEKIEIEFTAGKRKGERYWVVPNAVGVSLMERDGSWTLIPREAPYRLVNPFGRSKGMYYNGVDNDSGWTFEYRPLSKN